MTAMICYSVDYFTTMSSENECILDNSTQEIIRYLDSIIEIPPDVTETVPLRRVNRSFDRGVRRNGHRKCEITKLGVDFTNVYFLFLGRLLYLFGIICGSRFSDRR